MENNLKGENNHKWKTTLGKRQPRVKEKFQYKITANQRQLKSENIIPYKEKECSKYGVFLPHVKQHLKFYNHGIQVALFSSSRFTEIPKFVNLLEQTVPSQCASSRGGPGFIKRYWSKSAGNWHSSWSRTQGTLWRTSYHTL